MSDRPNETDIDIAEAERLLTEAFRGEGKRPSHEPRWRYRVIRHEDDQGGIWYGIHEVYNDGEGHITGCSGESHDVYGLDPNDLRHTLTLMLAALDLPVLREDGGALVEVEP